MDGVAGNKENDRCMGTRQTRFRFEKLPFWEGAEFQKM
jgi:hypothetical protein